VKFDISVIIPTFNRPAVLERTLYLLEAQKTELTFEVIIVNDGNPQSLPQLNLGKGNRIHWRLIQNPMNLGRAVTRNHGILEASGKYILFMDDDIWAVPGLIQAHYNKQIEIGGGVVVGAVPPAKENMTTVWHQYLANRYKKIEERLHNCPIDYSCFFTGNVSLLTSILKKHNGFDEHFREYSFEDTELGYRLFKAGIRFAHAHEAIGYHVLNETLSSLMNRAYQTGKSSVVLVKLAPDVFKEIQMHSKTLQKWHGVNIIKNIVKILISNNLFFVFILPLIKIAELIKLNSFIISILPYLEFGQHIRGVRNGRN
jgi:glycosyltransferase involved in cell wall biosynthesis